MSFVEGKEFVIKSVFADVLNMEDKEYYRGETVTHCEIPWQVTSKYSKINWVFLFREMSIYKNEDELFFYLKCLKRNMAFSIETDIKIRFSQGILQDSVKKLMFLPEHHELFVDYAELDYVKNLLVDGNLTVEMHVKISKTKGFKEKMRNFDDESAKKFSDVVLIVDDEKFYVCKKFLASHSSYFESLFMGNLEESKQSEITLKDVDPDDFHYFLDLIHGESDVNDETVDGILKLADKYDSPTSIRRCETFLTEHSKQSLKQKFEMAIKYNMDELKKKCLDEINTKEDILSVLPQDVHQMDQTVWAELLHKSISLM